MGTSSFLTTPHLAHALAQMKAGPPCLFLTGRAGTGKSTLLRRFRAETEQKLAVVAPTGIAALNVEGETVHSFFRFPPRPIAASDVDEVPDKSLYQALDTLVIDEVSMVRADVLDGIDRFLRLNGREADKPFGGVRMILVGDPFQLAPVVSSPAERQFLRAHYKTPYFFSASVLRTAGMESLELEQVFRQEDPEFVHLLNGIRSATVTPDVVDALNERCVPDFEAAEGEPFVTLTTTNARARHINDENLRRLKGTWERYDGEVEGAFAAMENPPLPAPATLALKKGAQVMFVKNDPERRWVNGTMGRVKKLDARGILVDVDGEEIDVEPVEWEMVRYEYDRSTRRIEAETVGAFVQFPLKVAYAITIHKSQGKTFDRVVVDLTGGTFAHGQVYVALSRCRTLEGIVLRRPLARHDLILDRAVTTFTRYRHLLESR
jgi:ATP-dependent exoDNAse (exonuclease V) alpha subunit